MIDVSAEIQDGDRLFFVAHRASGSNRNKRSGFLGFSNGCIGAMNTQAPRSDWSSANGWRPAIRGESRSNPDPAPGEDQSSNPSCGAERSATPVRHRIVVVEDNKGDVFLIREAIQAANVDAVLDVISDGEKAVQFFERADQDDSVPCPNLVIIDINLPKQHGGQVLAYMRKTRRCANTLALIVTSSDWIKDRDDMAKLGANGYFRKPSHYDEFMKLGEIVKGLLCGRAN